MQLVLNTYGMSLSVSKGVFFASSGDEKRPISAEQLSSIAVTAPISLSSAAIELAVNAGLSIYFFDEFGDAFACLRSPYFESLATLRRKQVYFSDRIEGAQWVLEQFKRKAAGQVDNLAYLQNRRPSLKADLQKAVDAIKSQLLELDQHQQVPSAAWSATLMGWEGAMARQYWQALAASIPEAWRFETRNRRPAKDCFNALINYFYGFLYAIVEQGLFAAGLDPHLGVLHVDEHDRPTLAFDLIEPFRPWVDRLILELIMTGKAETVFFDQKPEGVLLNSNGKRALIPLLNEYLKETVRWEGKQMSREAQIFRAAAELARLIQTTIQRP
jgi:CRISP-associated protein Cas1